MSRFEKAGIYVVLVVVVIIGIIAIWEIKQDSDEEQRLDAQEKLEFAMNLGNADAKPVKTAVYGPAIKVQPMPTDVVKITCIPLGDQFGRDRDQKDSLLSMVLTADKSSKTISELTISIWNLPRDQRTFSLDLVDDAGKATTAVCIVDEDSPDGYSGTKTGQAIFKLNFLVTPAYARVLTLRFNSNELGYNSGEYGPRIFVMILKPENLKWKGTDGIEVVSPRFVTPIFLTPNGISYLY